MAERDEQQQSGGFKVSDRRKFTPDGQLRPDVESDQGPAAPPPPPTQAARPETAPPVEAPLETGMETPFERLVVSFTSTAMMQLGLVALDPEQPLELDLMGARETIDMLGVLEEKTRGNLSAREARLLQNTLAELRMAFVEVQKRKGARR